MMITKKYELIEGSEILVTGNPMYRIRALINIKDFVRAGDLGGYVESEENLSHDGDAWVADAAAAFGGARVYEDACLFSNAWLYGKAQAYGNASVGGEARVYGCAKICGKAYVSGDALIRDGLISG